MYLCPLFISPLEFTPITSLINGLYKIFVTYVNQNNHRECIPDISPKTLTIVHVIHFIIQSFIWSLLVKSKENGCLKGNKNGCAK